MSNEGLSASVDLRFARRMLLLLVMVLLARDYSRVMAARIGGDR